jgi:hypothetical protein
VAERSKALDWNSSNILTGVRGFESHPLRQLDCILDARRLELLIDPDEAGVGFEPTNRGREGSTKSPGAILDDAKHRARRACGQDGRSNPTLSASWIAFSMPVGWSC